VNGDIHDNLSQWVVMSMAISLVLARRPLLLDS
jgi:hypothetical protein